MLELLSVRQAARRLGVAERVIHQAVRRGDLPAFKLGLRMIRVKPSDVDEWIQDRRVRSWDPQPKGR